MLALDPFLPDTAVATTTPSENEEEAQNEEGSMLHADVVLHGETPVLAAHPEASLALAEVALDRRAEEGSADVDQWVEAVELQEATATPGTSPTTRFSDVQSEPGADPDAVVDPAGTAVEAELGLVPTCENPDLDGVADPQPEGPGLFLAPDLDGVADPQPEGPSLLPDGDLAE
jgi:hypothetical protein